MKLLLLSGSLLRDIEETLIVKFRPRVINKIGLNISVDRGNIYYISKSCERLKYVRRVLIFRFLFYLNIFVTSGKYELDFIFVEGL
jgi:hypothetical protein